MVAEIYTNIAEALVEVGEIDRIGVTDDIGRTALSYAGHQVTQRYFDGSVRGTIIFQITGACLKEEQEELIEKLCGIMQKIKSTGITIEGLSRPKISITTLPIAVVNDGKKWIYSARIQVTGFYKE